MTGTGSSIDAGVSAEADAARTRAAQRLSPTERLIADLLAAGGVLRVPYWRREGEPDYRQRVDAARRWGKVPEGKRLVTDLVNGELEIRLVDGVEGASIVAEPVPVPARLSRPHPIARQYRDETPHHQVSRAALSRCVRIIHALVTESERRGYEVRKVHSDIPPARGYARRSMNGGPDFEITIRAHRYPLHISEEKVPLRGAWEDQERRRRSDYYSRQLGIEVRVGRYDKDGTGRLTIALDSHSREGRQTSWGDRRSWTLEDKLPDLLCELEIRAVEDDHAAAVRQRQAEERERQWEAAMAEAKARFAEAYRGDVLRAQLSAWEEAQRFERYLAELEAAHGSNPDAAEWIDWVRGYIRRLNPVTQPPTMPDVPEARPEDLKPFLGRWSPYGPSTY